MKDFLKSWKTSLPGLACFIMAGYEIYHKKDITVHAFELIIAGVGLFASKDFNVSNSKKKTG